MRRRSAFTLVEVMTVLLIVAFGMLPVISLMRGNTRQEALDESVVVAQSRALALAEAAVEKLHRAGFLRFDEAGGPEKVGIAPGEFSHTVVTEPVDPEAYLWRVTVTVSWSLPTDRGPGTPHHFPLVRLVSRPDGSFTGNYPYRRVLEP